MRPLPTVKKLLFLMISVTSRSSILQVFLLFFGISCLSSSLWAQSSVQPARASWDTGWFQTEIYRQLIQELGYSVEEARTMDNAEFYTKVGEGSIDFWANGWMPLHQEIIENSSNPRQIQLVGKQVETGAVQGYLIDKKSADELNISSLSDFSRPEVQQHFDYDNDGRADLVGCNPGWGCEQLIEFQLKDLGLQNAIDHKRGPYSLLMQNTIKRFQQDKPIFFFTWTPNWTIGALKPGDDVIWIELPHISTPGEQKSDSGSHIIKNPPGDQKNLLLGSPPNDILVAANRRFLKEHPDIHELFKQVKIPLKDILSQNARLLKGESDLQAIKNHARNWIDANRNKTKRWLEKAKAMNPQILSANNKTDRSQSTETSEKEK